MHAPVFLTLLVASALPTAVPAQVSSGGKEARAGSPIAMLAADLKWADLDPAGAPGVKIAGLWGNPASGAFGAFLKLPAGFAAPLHTHTANMKLVIVSGTYLQAPDGQAELRLGPGSYLFQPGGDYRHVTKCGPASECVFFVEGDGAFDLHPVPAAPAREVRGDTLVSGADPAARLVFSDPFEFAGGQTIDILKVAGAEQFFFIDAAEDRSIRRFYWVQFEHYYPANDHTYDFSSMNLAPVPFGRLEFVGDVRVRDDYFTMDKRPGSDSQAAQTFLQGKGFNIDGTFATLRLFHLPDTTRRRELMIIYGERVPAGTTAAAIGPDLTARARAGVALLE